MPGTTFVKVPNGLIDSSYIVSVLITQQGMLVLHLIDHKEYQFSEIKHVNDFLNTQAPIFLPQEYVDGLKQLVKTNSQGLIRAV